MITVYKYPVKLLDEFTIDLPRGAEFLCVSEQCGSPQAWFRVDTDKPVAAQLFSVSGTGHPISQSASRLPYKGTFQLQGGSLVFHLFGGIYA